MSEQDNIPTPRTDKAVLQRYRQQFCALPTDAIDPSRLLDVKLNPDFARILERELATVTNERDEAMRQRDALKSDLSSQVEEFKRTVQNKEKVELNFDICARERDAIRAEVERLKMEASEKVIRGAPQITPLTEVESNACAEAVAIPAPAQSEPLQEERAEWGVKLQPSQVDGKEPVFENWQREEKIEWLQTQLAAAQATIAELEQSRDQWKDARVGECKQLRTENAALRAERDDGNDFLAFMASALDEWPCECGEHKAASTPPMMWPELIACIVKKATSDLRAQLATVRAQRDKFEIQLTTAIAERDGAQKRVDKLESDLGDGGWADILRIVNERDIVKAQRDSALAACAAKDAALRVAHECINQYSDEGQSGRMTHYYAESKLPIITAALSLTAGIDYAPKAPMVELAKRVREFFAMRPGDALHYSNSGKRLSDALTAAAPFLTDSTGEEGK